MRRVVTILCAAAVLAVAGSSLAQPRDHDRYDRHDQGGHHDRYDRQRDRYDGYRHRHQEWRHQRHHKRVCQWRYHHRVCYWTWR